MFFAFIVLCMAALGLFGSIIYAHERIESYDGIVGAIVCGMAWAFGLVLFAFHLTAR